MSIVALGLKLVTWIQNIWAKVPDEIKQEVVALILEEAKIRLRDFFKWSTSRTEAMGNSFADFMKERAKNDPGASDNAPLAETAVTTTATGTAVATADEKTARIIRQVQAFVASDDFRDHLSKTIDQPKSSETEDQFVERSAAELRHQLEKALKGGSPAK